MSDPLKSKLGFALMLALIVLLYTVGSYVDVMEVDAAQYASMSQEMLQTGEFLQVHHRYQDYLDKPPLLFWLSSISFWNFQFHLQTSALRIHNVSINRHSYWSFYGGNKKEWDMESNSECDSWINHCSNIRSLDLLF